MWTFCWRNHSVRFFSLIRQVWWLIHTSVLTAAEFHPNLASAGIIGLILVESAMLTPRSAVEEDTEARWSRMLTLSSCRRDNWASRKEALQYFQSKRPWSRWDPGVLSLYIVRILQCDDPSVISMKLRTMVYMNILMEESASSAINRKKAVLLRTKSRILTVSHGSGS